MREVPVDVGTFLENVKGVVGIESVDDYDKPGEQSRTKEGVLKWKLQVLYKNPRIRKPDVVEIGFSANHDQLPDMADVGKGLHFRGLRAMLWEQGTRHGLSLACNEFSFGPWRSVEHPPADEDGVPIAA